MSNLNLTYKTSDIAENVDGFLSLLASWGHDVSELRTQPTKIKVYRARHVQRQLAYVARQKEKDPEAWSAKEAVRIKEYRTRQIEKYGEEEYRRMKREYVRGYIQRYIDKIGIVAYKEKLAGYYQNRLRRIQAQKNIQYFLSMLRSYQQKYEETQDEYYKISLELIISAYEDGRRAGVQLEALEKRQLQSVSAEVAPEKITENSEMCELLPA